ncbi:MAG: hypothetical protein JW797_13730 [Bradymonadales bacterium]|nr:hypothetical protein [Bradymonadales bacterium]
MSKKGMLKNLALVSVFALATALVGCPSDDGGDDHTTPDTTTDRGRDQTTTPDIPAETTPDLPTSDTESPDVTYDAQPDTGPNICASIPTCASIGTDCTTDEAVCGEGCQCVGATETTAECFQECRPDLCEAMCGENEYCVGLVNSQTEEPIEDEYGNPVGVCTEMDILECAEIGTCTTAGTDCTGNAAACGTDENSCGCIGSQTDADCYQLCLYGTCEDPCGDADCLQLGYYEGQTFVPLEQPDGTFLGACVPPCIGDQVTYEECDGDTLCCEAGLECAGFCTQTCTPTTSTNPTEEELQADCPDALAAHEGALPACFIQFTGDDNTYCGYICSPTVATSCPTGLTCYDLGEDIGVCVY